MHYWYKVQTIEVWLNFQRWLIGGALFLLLMPIADAQQPTPTPIPAASPQQRAATGQDDDDIVRVNVNLVQVEAIVKDKKGKLVTDLQSDDFEIVENGSAHPLNFFSFIPLTENRENIAASDKRLARNEVRRTIVFMIANPLIDVGISVSNAGGAYTSSFTLRPRAFTAAQGANQFLNKFISEQMGERDLISIVDTDADMGLLSSFTNDRELLRATAKQMMSNLGNGQRPVIRIMVGNYGVGLEPLIAQNMAVLKMAESAVEQLQKVPGRKIVVLLARGLLYASSDLIRDRIKELVEKANKAQVTFYGLHLAGLEGAGAGADALIALSEKTGGRAIRSTNDVSVGFGEILKENSGYYLLAYNPGQEAVPQPHQIQVRVKRPGLRAQFRSTAYRNEAKTESLDANETLLRILRSPFATNEVKLTLIPTFQPESKTKGHISTALNIPSAELEPELQSDGMRHIKLDLALQVTGPDNKLIREEIKNYTIKLNDAEWNEVTSNGLTYQFNTDITQSGYYRVNVAVRVASSGRTGSVSRFINCKPFAAH